MKIVELKHCSSTYNLRKIFVKSMGWDYEHGLYPCSDVLEYIHRGLSELTINGIEYRKFEPPNGCGTVETAIETLTSVQKCILETSKKIPVEHIFFSWYYSEDGGCAVIGKEGEMIVYRDRKRSVY